MEYNFREVEKKWQKYWEENQTFKVEINHSKPKYYVLDMFPYPSGAGLHVGHPFGYIASDIYARYKRLLGYNVLHPMGFDAYGLPAEQYAIQTGTHPAITTEKNILRYRDQLYKIGFSFDWTREVKTCDPKYYKWTQWTFIQLFNSWYNNKTRKAEPITGLLAEFEKNGNSKTDAACNEIEPFTAKEWEKMNEKQRQEILMNYRLAYLSDTWVNWCPALGTVLANDEVKDGFSERGGHPVEQKLMKQWSLRITAYAQRLLDGLEKIDWPDSLREVQRNWIGRSVGASVNFRIKGFNDIIKIFTTRPDTLFGATFMVLSPEHELVEKITTPEQQEKVLNYVIRTKSRSERERISEVKKISGEFTGSYGINPLNSEEIPIWIADYVLAGYGTGAIMAVPAHDSRDFAFAKHFRLPIIQVITRGDDDVPENPYEWEDSYDSKEGKAINSGFITGMEVPDAINTVIKKIKELGVGYGTVNYKLRDAIFSRQRYWGEPFPVYYKNGMPYTIDENELPLILPDVDKYLPTEKGDPPLARAKNWKTKDGYPIETNTMPGFAGSSGYYLRYQDPHNDNEYFSKEANDYWQNVDLYIGGDEHGTGHLIYSRFWNMFLHDLGLVNKEEPFQKLINQGKIQGRSNFVYRIKGTNKFVSYNLRKNYQTIRQHVDINLVNNDILNIDGFRVWQPELKDAKFILEKGKYICGWEIEKMSKSKHNVQNPDDLIEKYGADTLRIYEMFLGPIEQSKPWDTNGIEGVFRFMRKLWKLYFRNGEFTVSDELPSEQELNILHKTIKKVRDDIDRFSFNTVVSALMICVNKLTELKCYKKTILENLAIIVSPYAPHITEELWEKSGHNYSITNARFPEADEKYLIEENWEYPVSFNGKLRFKIILPLEIDDSEIETAVLKNDKAQKWLGGKHPKKIIFVPKKIINVVV
jgi:leucyl-tRNA synthetase